MYQDVADLNAFYRSRLGQVTRRVVLARVRAIWPDIAGQSLLGLGYAMPYLRVFNGEAERVLGLCPAAQGVIRWPNDGPSQVALIEEDELPLPDESMDRILLVHAVETSEMQRHLMRQVWRVLAPGGRILVLAANRRGMWARADRTPFGHGHPFSEQQLDRLLRASMFTPLRTEFALYVPPIQRGLSLWSAPAWERVGRRWGLPLPGIVMIEASKQMYGVTPAGAKALRRRSRALAGAAAGS